jgi:antitoxin component YwqK of YwqJK toxin-antitoxin module
MTPEKEIILSVFNTLKYMDNNITSIIDDYIQGYFEEYNRLGKVKARYKVKYGIRNGEYKEWYTNGVLRIYTTYKDGKLQGEYKEWWSNKRLMFFFIYNEGTCEWCKGSWDRAGHSIV